MALLDGTPWTPALDFQNSLALRSERTVVDSSVPYAMRLEQIYSPAIELTPALTRQGVAAQACRPRRAGAPRRRRRPCVKELGAFDGVSRDLRESPFAMELDLAGVEDGAYVIETQVLDGTTSLGHDHARRGPAQGPRCAAEARSRPPRRRSSPAVRADVMYPADYIRNVNRGRIGLQTFNVGAEVAAAEAVLAAAKGGKDPFKGRTGDFERHYLLEGANEVMPYRVYVPKALRAHRRRAARDRAARARRQRRLVLRPVLEAAAAAGREARLPAGGAATASASTASTARPMMGGGDAAARRRVEYSEKDVLEVLRLMKAAYKVDESRIYLIGHSMGAIGTWALGAKYPQTVGGARAVLGRRRAGAGRAA